MLTTETRFRLSGCFRLDARQSPARLECPAEGSAFEVEDVNPDDLERVWSLLDRALGSEELERVLAPLGGDALVLRELFESEGIIRPCDLPSPHVSGDPELCEIVDALSASGGWGSDKLQLFTARELFERTEPTSEALAVIVLRDAVLAGRGLCRGCLILRALAVLLTPGEAPTAAELRCTLAPEDLRSALARTLLEVQRAPLEVGEALLLRFGEGLERGALLRHPDCDACAAGHGETYGTAWLREDLLRSEEAARIEHVRDVFGASPFAPLAMEESVREPRELPYDLPYLAGDTRLCRFGSGKVACRSIEGIVHGSGTSTEHSRLVAWSEGIERLAAQSARPHVLADAGDARVASLRSSRIFPELDALSGVKAFSKALDLRTDRECLVPFERVAVHVPPGLFERDARIERTFTGAASHVTSLNAILHASVEVLTRDAYLLAWYRRRRLCRVAWPASASHEVTERARYLRAHGLELELYDLRADLPLPLLLLRARATRTCGNWPRGGTLLVPAGGFFAQESLRHALSLASSRFVGLGLYTLPERDPLDAEAVEALSRTVPFWPGLARYLDPARAQDLEFLFGDIERELTELDAGTELSAEAPHKAKFEALRRWLERAGLSWFAVPLVDRDILQAGLRVVKVIIPEALRLTLLAEEIERQAPRFSLPLAGAAPDSWNERPHPLY
jgi:thiazole/oxazole-forming peptide maturase SagD family component